MVRPEGGGVGGDIAYYFLNGRNFSFGDPISMILWFSESLKGALSFGMLKPNIIISSYHKFVS